MMWLGTCIRLITVSRASKTNRSIRGAYFIVDPDMTPAEKLRIEEDLADDLLDAAIKECGGS
jgi:hypothetical protein